MDQVIINEEWRSIDGYINYQVSNIGRVRNSKTGRILKQCLDKDGYYQVGISCDSTNKRHRVHRLVANEFLEKHDKLNYYIVDHIDRDRTNNKVFNLRYATLSQNNFNQVKVLNIDQVSIYKGVYKKRAKWYSSIQYKGKRYYLGNYDIEEEAAVAYNMKALEFGGEYAYLNNI